MTSTMAPAIPHLTQAAEGIPFLDLVTPHRELEEQLLAVVRKALRGAAFIGGEELLGFEREFAAYTRAAECAGVSSGTDALRFAIMAMGVKPGDEVITVSHTFMATTESITQAGAKLVLVDVDPVTM